MLDQTIPNVKISDYPQLMLICWSRDRDGFISEDDALALYERNWRWVDVDLMEVKEKLFIDRLVLEYGNGVLLV